jgi:cellulose synthase/poly-beta-1,6-N-acetylglucosamine synthase-like glycosyltransferase
VHGWDAFNVTEDADLGVRLARRGFRVLPIDSSTYEEAIPSLGGWIRQRSRWLKGYMQTGLVHLRDPYDFIRAVGIMPFFGFTLFVVGAAATSLLSPLVWMLSIVLAFTGSEVLLGPYGGAVMETSCVTLIGGNALLTLLAMLAPLKRRWFGLVLFGASVFLYWLLISLAAYKALWQLKLNPFYWEKTSHGTTRKRGPHLFARFRG